jgi:transcriptional regulator with XRE-family HTH domain
MTYFAEKLKKLRTSSGLTMDALAQLSNVSKSMISKIERDEVQPTIDVAARIAKAFNKTLSEMLHTTQSTAVVFLPQEQQAVWEDAQHIKRRNISPVFEGLKIEWLQVELPPESNIIKCYIPGSDGGEKYVLVTSGLLEIKINQEVYRLKKGDSLYFNSNCEHEFANIGNDPVEYFIVVKHPE